MAGVPGADAKGMVHRVTGRGTGGVVCSQPQAARPAKNAAASQAGHEWRRPLACGADATGTSSSCRHTSPMSRRRFFWVFFPGSS